MECIDADELCNKNTRLVYYFVRRYYGWLDADNAVSIDDITQCAFIGLLAAGETFKEGAGMKWASWAIMHMRKEVQSLIGCTKSKRAHWFDTSLDEPLGDDCEGDTRLDMLADEGAENAEARLDAFSDCDALHEAVNRLPELQRKVVTDHAFHGKPFTEIAQDMGKASSGVREHWVNALRNMRKDTMLGQELALDLETRFYAHKGITAFNRDWTSTTEGAAIWRIECRERNLTNNDNA